MRKCALLILVGLFGDTFCALFSEFLCLAQGPEFPRSASVQELRITTEKWSILENLDVSDRMLRLVPSFTSSRGSAFARISPGFSFQVTMQMQTTIGSSEISHLVKLPELSVLGTYNLTPMGLRFYQRSQLNFHVFGGIGVLCHNPKAKYQGEWYAL